MNHKWNKENKCLKCGVKRTKVNTVYGKLWRYGYEYEECKSLVKDVGFERPDCKPKNIKP